MLELAEQRSNVYKFLMLVYIQVPTDKFIELIRNSELIDVIEGLGLTLDEKFRLKNKDELLEELELEYNRLFLNPGKHIPLNESVWRDKEKLLCGESTLKVKRFIESSGLRFNDNWTGIPDSLGAELEFMQKLSQGERDAWKKNDKKTALRCLESEREFIDKHLSQWVKPFCDKVIEEAQTSFYKQMAKLTLEFIEFDRKQIDSMIRDSN